MQQDRLIQIALLGEGGSGKSWLANRLVLGFEQSKYDSVIDIDENQQIFKEDFSPMVKEIKSRSVEQNSYQIKGKDFKIIETIGIGQNQHISKQKQIQYIVSQLNNIDLYIYVQSIDYQLTQENLQQFQFVSQLCTSQKLLVFLTRSYIYENKNQQFEKMMGFWRDQSKLYALNGIFTEVFQIGKFIENLKLNFQGVIKQQEIIQQQDPQTSVLIISKQINNILKFTDHLMGYKFENYQNVEGSKYFKIAILDVKYLGDKIDEIKFKQLVSDQKINKKLIIFFDKADNVNFTKYHEIVKLAYYMKEQISLETLIKIAQNEGEISKNQILNVIGHK